MTTSAIVAGTPQKLWANVQEQSTNHDIKIRFLGTGAADWNGKDERGELRRWSSILVDDKVLIDFTPSNMDMLPVGCRPDTIFYTHSHGDHYHPKAALQAGVQKVYLSETWFDIAYADFQNASRELGLPMPDIQPISIGQHVEVHGISFSPLPANHATNYMMEQTLIYLLEKEGTRLIYATDTGGLMGKATRLAGIDAHQSGQAIHGLIMEATMGMEHAIDYRLFTHSSVATVQQTVQVLTDTKRYLPATGQWVYLTHMARTLHGTQAALDNELPSPLRAAYDGLEVVFTH